ncbi:MAG: hypothetical protein NVS9B8_09040 [Candidatus Limnocylindrales bacterium]
MPIRVEIYASSGVAVGVVARPGRLREVLEAGPDLLIERTVWHPLDGTPARAVGPLTLALDDILIAVADEADDGPVHAQWHDIRLEIGPYLVTGEMPTMPGFDPGRALARPTGEFVLLRLARITLGSAQDDAALTQPTALVNRYVVERVAADLMLGFFFPGAEMAFTSGHERSAAGISTGAPPPDAPDPARTIAAPTAEAAMGATGEL